MAGATSSRWLQMCYCGHGGAWSLKVVLLVTLRMFKCGLSWWMSFAYLFELWRHLCRWILLDISSLRLPEKQPESSLGWLVESQISNICCFLPWWFLHFSSSFISQLFRNSCLLRSPDFWFSLRRGRRLKLTPEIWGLGCVLFPIVW